MTRWLARGKQFLLDESGPTAVEYAVMLALIVVVCIAAVGTLGSTASTVFRDASLNDAAGSKSP